MSEFVLGIKDGWAEPFDLGRGMTWDDSMTKNRRYDRGVNLGQRLRQIVILARHPLTDPNF